MYHLQDFFFSFEFFFRDSQLLLQLFVFLFIFILFFVVRTCFATSLSGIDYEKDY